MRELPGAWACVNLLDCSTFVRGVTYSRGDASDLPAPGFVPIIRANNIQGGRLELGDLVYVPEGLVSAEQTLRVGDVVIATSSGSISVVGKAAQVRTTSTLSFGAFCGVLRPSNVINARYFGHFFMSKGYRDTVSEMARGVNINNLKRDHFQSIALPLAPEPEQRRIADKLDTELARVDSVNDRLARVAPLLKRFRQSVLAAAVSGKLTEEWRDERGLAAWGATTVAGVAAVGTGSTPLRSNAEFFSSAGTPWVTSAATGQEVVRSATEFVTDAAIAAHRLRRYPVGTLLVAMYGEGKTRGQVTELGIEATINQACAAIVVDESKISRTFVKLALQANYFSMRELAEGGNQPNLNLAKVKSFPIPLPSPEEQTEISLRVLALLGYADRLEARLQAAQAATERLTPALLAKAFRGELVPQDPNDEPASELLKRLAAQRAQASPVASRPRGRKPAERSNPA